MIFVAKDSQHVNLGLKLSAARQHDDVLEEFQRARFAAVLIVDFTVHVVRVSQLNQPRLELKIAMVPALQDQSAPEALRG